MNYVYLLRCSDDTLYCGWTTDLEKRLTAHNAGIGAKFTRSRRPVELVYFEEYENRHDALSREWHVKRMSREEKLRLLENSGLIQKMRIAGVGVQELQMRNEWVDGYEIRVSIENGEAVISANREGLLSLAKQMTALAEETPGSHIHYDRYNSLEEGSAELIIVRTGDCKEYALICEDAYEK